MSRIQCCTSPGVTWQTPPPTTSTLKRAPMAWVCGTDELVLVLSRIKGAHSPTSANQSVVSRWSRSGERLGLFRMDRHSNALRHPQVSGPVAKPASSLTVEPFCALLCRPASDGQMDNHKAVPLCDASRSTYFGLTQTWGSGKTAPRGQFGPQNRSRVAIPNSTVEIDFLEEDVTSTLACCPRRLHHGPGSRISPPPAPPSPRPSRVPPSHPPP